MDVDFENIMSVNKCSLCEMIMNYGACPAY